MPAELKVDSVWDHECILKAVIPSSERIMKYIPRRRKQLCRRFPHPVPQTGKQITKELPVTGGAENEGISGL